MVGYASFMKHTYSINKFDGNEIAKCRLKVIKFFDQFGLKATKEAFNVGRSTVFLWKKKLKGWERKSFSFSSLLHQAKDPKKNGSGAKDFIGFIKNLRENNGRIGKEKIIKSF